MNAAGKEIAKRYPEIAFDDLIVDATTTKVVIAHERFDVIATMNLFGDILGDILGDLAADLIAGSASCRVRHRRYVRSGHAPSRSSGEWSCARNRVIGCDSRSSRRSFRTNPPKISGASRTGAVRHCELGRSGIPRRPRRRNSSDCERRA
jgi:hypothetical protein